MRKIKNPKIGEYVLLTKYSDKDSADPWFIGFFTRKIENVYGTVYKAKDNNGNEHYYNKFRHCFRITKEDADNWFKKYNLTWGEI